jgi:hypothetical protein
VTTSVGCGAATFASLAGSHLEELPQHEPDISRLHV